MTLYSVSARDLEEHAQSIKNVILEAMNKEGIIDCDTAGYWQKNYAIIVRNKSFWKGIFRPDVIEKEKDQWIMIKRITEI